MYVLHGSERFLPELKLNRSVKLRETRVKVVLQGVSIGEVDGVWLMRVFRNVRQMETKCLAKAAELNFSLVFETKFERLLGNLLRMVWRVRSAVHFALKNERT